MWYVSQLAYETFEDCTLRGSEMRTLVFEKDLVYDKGTDAGITIFGKISQFKNTEMMLVLPPSPNISAFWEIQLLKEHHRYKLEIIQFSQNILDLTS